MTPAVRQSERGRVNFGVVMPDTALGVLDPYAHEAATEPRITYDVALGSVVTAIGFNGPAIAERRRARGLTGEQVLKPIHVSAEVVHDGQGYVAAEVHKDLHDTTYYMGSALAEMVTLPDGSAPVPLDDAHKEWIYRNASLELTATAAHEEEHVMQKSIPNDPSIARVLRAQTRYERRIAATKALPGALGTLAATAVAGACAEPMVEAGGTVELIGSTLSLGIVVLLGYAAFAVRDVYKRTRGTIRATHYAEQPIEIVAEQAAEEYVQAICSGTSAADMPPLLAAVQYKLPAQMTARQ